MYEVAMPITGFVIYQVDAESETDAKAKVAEGTWDDVEYDVDRDMNQEEWEVQEQ
jgi:hypothetical protein